MKGLNQGSLTFTWYHAKHHPRTGALCFLDVVVCVQGRNNREHGKAGDVIVSPKRQKLKRKLEMFGPSPKHIKKNVDLLLSYTERMNGRSLVQVQVASSTGPYLDGAAKTGPASSIVCKLFPRSAYYVTML